MTSCFHLLQMNVLISGVVMIVAGQRSSVL